MTQPVWCGNQTCDLPCSNQMLCEKTDQLYINDKRVSVFLFSLLSLYSARI